jgi:uncharacterized protein involved in exopolysaccharide biosynthesis
MSVTTDGVRNRRRAHAAMEAAPPPAAGLTSWHDMLALAFKHRLRFLLALLGPPAVAAALIYLLPPVYRAQTSLVVGTGPEYLAQGDGSSIMTAPMTTKQEFINTEIELLSNPAVVENTITRIGLANLYPDLLSSQMGPQLARDTAVRTFEAALKVAPVKLSNVIRVTFDHANGQMAARTLDQFIVSYQELHAKVFAGRRAAGYEERIDRDTKELEKLESTRAQTKAAFGVYDLGQQRTALIQQRVEAEKQLRQTVDRADALTTRLAYLAQTRPGLASEMLSSQTESNPAALHAAEVLMDLRQKEAAMAAAYDPQNPLVKRLRAQTELAQKQLADLHATNTRISLTPSPITTAIDQELITAQAELAPLKAQEQIKRMLIAVIGQKMQNIEQADLQLRMIDSRTQEVTEDLVRTRKQYESARTAEANEQAKVSTEIQTSAAAIPEDPIEPDKVRLLGLGILGGLISAYGVLCLAARAIQKARTTASFGLFLGLPVSGSMPVRVNSHHFIK